MEGVCDKEGDSADAMHGTSGSGSGKEGEHVFVEVMEQHGKGLLIFGVMTVACLVVMCIILVVIVWMTKKKEREPLYNAQEDGGGDGRNNVQL